MLRLLTDLYNNILIQHNGMDHIILIGIQPIFTKTQDRNLSIRQHSWTLKIQKQVDMTKPQRSEGKMETCELPNKGHLFKKQMIVPLKQTLQKAHF